MGIQTEYLFDYLRTTETMLKDQYEIHILMKYVDYSTSIIPIFLCMKTFSVVVQFVTVLAIILVAEYFLPNIT